MKIRKLQTRTILFIILNFFILQFLSSATLEDIRKKLNKNQKQTQKTKKEKIDLKDLKPGNLKGWKTKSTRDKPINAYALFASFKINEKTDFFHLPLTFCYIYDKDKNLIDRLKPGMLFGTGHNRGKEIEGELMVPGKRVLKIAFPYPADLVYKYAVCVMGNQNDQAVYCYPKSTDWQEFEFDEKQLINNK